MGELLKQRLAPEAHDRLLPRGTARSQGCSARPSGPRRTPPSSQTKAVAYINTDGNGSGFLNVGGSHALEAFVNGVARDIEDPESR